MENKETDHSQVTDRLLDAAGIAVERLPMLPVVFDRMARFFADRMRQRAPSQAYVSVSYIENERIGEILDASESNALVAITHCPEWDNRMLIGFDRDFIYSMIEVLLGADGAEEPFDDSRAFSNIEIGLSTSLFKIAISALQDALKPISEVTLRFERVESRMDFAVVGRRNNPAVVARLLLQAIGRGGEMFVVIPHSTLNPIRQSLTQVIAGDTSGLDSEWTNTFRGEIEMTSLQLNAVLDEIPLALDQLSDLKVGQVLKLRANARTPVRLECRGRALFECQLGQADGMYTLKVDQPIIQDGEEFNGFSSDDSVD